MKKKIAITVTSLALVAALGTGLYFVMQRNSAVAEIQPLEETSPLSVDYNTGETASNANIVLDDQSEAIKKAQEEAAVRNVEKANGTGEYAAIETSDDLAYQQQLSEEYGTPMPNTSITMYAKTTCNVRADASTDSAVVSSLKKGDKVTVSEVGDWNKVVFDDGTEGYVRSDLLEDENTTTKKEETSTTPPATNTETQPPAQNDSSANTGGSGAYTQEQTNALLQQMLADGFTTGGGQQGEVHQAYVDPNSAENSGVDISGVTLH